VVVSGCIGPRGDGYQPDSTMSADQAQAYHAVQIETFADTEADLVTAITMTYADEAVGITRAAQAEDLPVVISFTAETDGRLPTGETLGQAIEAVDAATGSGPAYYMVNCAHPSHFSDALEPDADWTQRIRGVRANASRLSHAELDEAEELDSGDPRELAQDYLALSSLLPQLAVLGGCCGTTHEHVSAISRAFTAR
jgi:S-methylmethionine-dependent homocysteine/selenocysteine methylase